MGSVLGDPLQLIVEQLAERLGRSVILDDWLLRPLAVSAQTGQVDQSRIDAILQRRTDKRILDLLAAHELRHARAPVRIPPNEELGTLGRVVIPILADKRQLGFLWLIDDPELTPAELGRAQAAATEVATLLAERAAQEFEAAQTARRLFDGLLRSNPQARARAAEQLREFWQPADADSYIVIVIIDPRAPSRKSSTELTQAAESIRRRTGSHGVVCTTPRAGELVALTTGGRRELALRAFRDLAGRLAIGTRRHVPALEAVHDACADARYAAEVAAAVAGYNRCADWSDLGPYACFQHIERAEDSLERICPGVSALWTGRGDMYVETVRAYLQHGANAQKSAAALHIHRTTLYWRLENVERILGLDLSDGDDRLRLHLALKLKDLIPDPGAAVTRPLPVRP